MFSDDKNGQLILCNQKYVCVDFERQGVLVFSFSSSCFLIEASSVFQPPEASTVLLEALGGVKQTQQNTGDPQMVAEVIINPPFKLFKSSKRDIPKSHSFK